MGGQLIRFVQGESALKTDGILNERMSTMAYTRAILVAAMVCVSFVACSNSTTYRESEEKPTGILQEENEFVYLAKIKREKAREDDKRVNVRAIQDDLVRESDLDDTTVLPNGAKRDELLLEMVNYLGVRYSFGGSTKKGMDCSAFTSLVFKNAAKKVLPRSTFGQFREGIKIAKNKLQFGDLVFFNTTGRSPSHVGIYIEEDIFAHASVVEGVTLSSLESTYYKKRFVGARRIVE